MLQFFLFCLFSWCSESFKQTLAIKGREIQHRIHKVSKIKVLAETETINLSQYGPLWKRRLERDQTKFAEEISIPKVEEEITIITNSNQDDKSVKQKIRLENQYGRLVTRRFTPIKAEVKTEPAKVPEVAEDNKKFKFLLPFVAAVTVSTTALVAYRQQRINEDMMLDKLNNKRKYLQPRLEPKQN